MALEATEARASGRIFPKSEPNTRATYEHQELAMQSLDRMNLSPSYSTLVVLPTGGGKTYTMSRWLLNTALDHHKKVLWMAHRHLLLEQAAESFQNYAYAEVTPHIDSFRFRIVSGAVGHDRLSDIEPGDDLLIISKDSVARNPACLDEWLDGLEELYLVIDEAHHSTAKSYRKVIGYIKDKVPNVKLIGLTATPFQKDVEDPGLLGEIYTDNIAYEIGIKSLIAKQILSTPTFEERYTEEEYSHVGLRVLESIQRSDLIPDDIAEKMATSAVRNQLIVDTYLAHRKKYGQTIVFAVNVIHAVQLTGIFKNAGVKADYVASGFRDAETGALAKKSDNDRKIEEYRRGELQVLISVNILAEGVDLPKTKSVFLARPTVSSVLMTQMVGRALRGTAAGGTAEAYIVSFIDKWNEHIAWVNPQSLFLGAGGLESDPAERAKSDIRTIAVAKIEEFAKILDDSVDTTALEEFVFLERIPRGMYCIRLEGQSENGDGADYIDQVMAYDNSIEYYEAMMKELPSLFESYGATELEYLPDDLLSRMESHCRFTYFDEYPMVPPYHAKDVRNILKYYAQYGRAPRFYTFDDIDRSKLDVQKIAQHIWDARLKGKERREYENSIWNSGDENMLRLLFGKKIYFLRHVDIEYIKIAHPDAYAVSKTVRYGNKEIADLTLAQIRDIDPDEWQRLRRVAFDNFKNCDGEYWCAKCGEVHADKGRFRVIHILPLPQGGKSIPSNMQILCRSCYEKEKQQ